MLQARWVGRQWRYRIQWSEAAPRVTKNIVTVTSKPRTRDTGGVVGVAVWTHPRTAHAQDTRQPVAVFARVSLGSSPVLGATVYLDVEVMWIIYCLNNYIVLFDQILFRLTNILCPGGEQQRHSVRAAARGDGGQRPRGARHDRQRR